MAAIALGVIPLQIYLYSTVAEVIEPTGTPHDDGDDEGDSDVELVGGGWWKGFRRFPIHFVRKFRQMTFGAAILGTAVW
jgi:hypothetical protein